MSIQYAIYASLGGNLIADYSHRVTGLTFATNNRGYAECSGFVPMGLPEAFALFDRTGLPHVQISDNAAGVRLQGRLEDVAIDGNGVTLTAMGYSRSLSDAPYTALWSTTDVGAWVTLDDSVFAGIAADKYKIDYSNRVYVALQKGTAYTNTLDYGIVGFRRASGSSRGIVGLSFDMVMSLPAGWDLIISRRDDAWGSGATLETIAGTGGAVTISKCYTFTASGSVTFLIYNNSGALHTHALENGISFISAINVRVVTATTNMVNTTNTAGWTAGANVTITVSSTARMYAGQRLSINYGATSETVVIASVTNSTQFIAVSVGTTTAGTGHPIQSFIIYADEIVKDLVSVTNTLNATQLSSSIALIQSPALDLFNEQYDDRRPSEILDYLITLGDLQTPPRQWEWGVRDAQQLYYRPQLAQRVWYIDVSELDVQRSLDELYNSCYAIYQEAGGRTLRASVTADVASVARYGVTRRMALSVSTTSAVQAAVQQAAALNDGKDPKPRSGVTIREVFDDKGSRYPLWSVASGDTIVIRNLSPTLSSALDRIRVFRISRTEYQASSDTLTLEPESPLPSLQALLAAATAPSFVTAPWWEQERQ